jgi:hypothetical protein
MPEEQEKGQERVAFYLTVVLALVITIISIWIILPEHLSLIQLIVTAITTFVSILGAESFLQRMWKPFDRVFSPSQQANAQPGKVIRRSITARFSITILLTSITFSLFLSGVLWLTVFTKILSSTIGIYRVLAFVGIFFLSYCFSFFGGSLALEYRQRPGRVRHLFVNRTVEMQRLSNLVQSLHEVAWTQIYGIQGIGKTKLLQEFKYQMQRKWGSRFLSWHELRCFPDEKRDWETLLRDTYKFKYNTTHTVQEEFLSTIRTSTVITIDDFPYHNATFIKGFIDTLIELAHNHKSILIVTTARERVKFDSTRLPSHIKVLEPTVLNPLDSEAIGQYLHGFERVYAAKYKSNKEVYDDIYRERANVQTIAYGHPYIIDNILISPNLWASVKSKPDKVVDINDLSRNMCANFSAPLLEALQAVAVVAKHTRDWSEDTLLGVVNSETVCAELLEKNLVYQVGDSYRMHDIMQSYIYEELLKSGEHCELHQTIATFYEQKTRDADASIFALKHYLSAGDSSGTKRVHKRAIERSNFIGNFSESIQLGELSLALVKGQAKALSTLPREDQRVIVDLLLLQSYAFKVQGK